MTLRYERLGVRFGNVVVCTSCRTCKDAVDSRARELARYSTRARPGRISKDATTATYTRERIRTRGDVYGDRGSG